MIKAIVTIAYGYLVTILILPAFSIWTTYIPDVIYINRSGAISSAFSIILFAIFMYRRFMSRKRSAGMLNNLLAVVSMGTIGVEVSKDAVILGPLPSFLKISDDLGQGLLSIAIVPSVVMVLGYKLSAGESQSVARALLTLVLFLPLSYPLASLVFFPLCIIGYILLVGLIPLMRRVYRREPLQGIS